MFLHPFADSYLYSRFENKEVAGGRIEYVRLFSAVAFFILIIACINFMNLSTARSTKRTKEIGIRKVLGASIQNLVLMLSKDFTKPVVLAMVIAVPISWFLMSNWLDDYAYRIDISWWVFVLGSGIALLVAWLTVSWQSIKAATMNPTKSLKIE